MKRLRVDETGKESSINEPSVLSGVSTLYRQQQQSLPNVAPALSYSTAPPGTVKVVSEGMQSGLYAPPPPVSYAAIATTAPSPQALKPQAMPPPGGGATVLQGGGTAALQESPPGSQRLKVEDALSYLDLVKYKFGSKPQVYNDFLDIMKEFKSQSIDTPGVIQRVSNLFKGFPELIVGFNTFLPPGYKIEVQRNDQGYAFQVSVSMPSPTTGAMPQEHRSAMILKGSGTISVSAPSPAAPPAAPPPPVAPQVPPPQPPPPPPVVHHSPSTYGGNAPSYAALSLSAAQAAVTHALGGHTETPQNQPVEFNHAINYVNKIKNRFQGQPEKYKKFLEILHTYQKEQRTLKENSSIGSSGMKHLTEQEVYSQVAKLFENQSDLLAEFGQFLPDATSHINQAPISEHVNSVKKTPVKPYHRGDPIERHSVSSHKPSHVTSGGVKRSPTYSNYQHSKDAPPPKKHKMSSTCRDVTLSEAGKYGTLNDYAFFDKVRKALRSQDAYNNFLRCLTLFNQEIVSKSELIQISTPFIGKFPELLRWFREFLGQNNETTTEAVPFNVARNERPQGDHALEIDLATAKRLGASYCIIPKAQEGMKCSGRTQLCKEVLNDQWVSFPTWSEDSTFVSSRKTQYEEYMYRCEDERFELDVVIEVNASTIRVLEGVNKKLSRMSQDDASKYKLDDCLGGSSPTLHQRAIRRIYGDKAQDIIDGLKRNPAVAVPVVLRRLKTKEEEWREAQKGFNKIWREQNEKYYLKSLDHQGINFKQTDVKALRSKSLFNEIETIFDERHEQNDEGTEPVIGPHLVLFYRDRTILDDAANLLIHHVKRQTGIQKGEKRRIKNLLRQFLPDLFFHPRQQLSDDEREEDDEKDESEESPNSSPKSDKDNKGKDSSNHGKSPGRCEVSLDEIKQEIEIKDEEHKVPLHAQTSDPEEVYTLFMANNNWYIFLRLHAILCDRLAKIYERAVGMAAEEAKFRSCRKESTAVALRLKPKPQIEIEDYYPAFLDMVKNLLDGNMEGNTYEDTLREMFGIHAYVAFTLDKVVSYAVRQLQHCVTERTAIACSELFAKEQKRGAAGGPCITAQKRAHMEMAYQRAGEKAVQEENCFKIYIYKRDCRMTIELLDTEPEDGKKVDDAKKWSVYKECYTDITSSDRKPRSPVYLNRNLRLYKRRAENNYNRNKRVVRNHQLGNMDDGGGNENFQTLQDAIERKLNERGPPERNVTDHPGYEVNDETQCKFNMQDSKIMFAVTKDSYLYNISAFHRARKSHPQVTKQKATRFRQWLKRWACDHVSDTQSKQCTDWLMGRCDGVVPNRTRVLTDNDLSRTPYVPYNRYRVERLLDDSADEDSPS
ncbi:SIN3 transcription regulator family member A isoform X2 [Leptinotarsa decemlineata]|uniref:SIN3 transcription regulator family member A isoform X2 n=1 Tax=Leptinotarsa decemlineata TaxID=7539 RepID=UPI000C2524CA|nr:paired amphipathic helix protein Sin3b [Leptinotarsa decemlineata]XP_023025931.1 paired amphipathic helix protein Sin3b [Leptinotarsa decemlineata]XP_023025932.1 paired amphipathic helix protein Sin3b [Leptinotarsa decemlineata]XP_023025933.1 paired amphipathic helix protein Sin3b [Leptinotarsa decemlineata]